MADLAMRIESALPSSEDGYAFRLITKIAKATDAAARALLPQKVPPVQVPPAPKGGRWDGPLPPSVFVPALLLLAAAREVGGAGYDCEPGDLVDDSALELVLAKLQKLAADTKVRAAAKSAGAPPPPPPRGAPAKMPKGLADFA